MRKVWAVVRREFLERVRTKQFVIGTLLGPVLMGVVFVSPLLLQRSTRPKRIAVLDAADGKLGVEVTEALERVTRNDRPDGERRYRVVHVPAGERVEAVRDSLVALTDRGTLGSAGFDGVLVLTEETLDRNTLDYLGNDAGSIVEMGTLRRVLVPAVLTDKLVRSGIEAGTLLRTIRPVELRTAKVSRGRLTGQSGDASFALAYIMAFVLYTALVLYGVQVMTSTVEEKAGRVSEILVSSLRPFEFLLGKILGVGSVGLLQLSIWAGAAYLFGVGRGVLAQLGVAAALVPWLAIPEIPMGALLVFLLFFVLGFFFFAAAYAAVGSTCSTVEETQQASMPVTLLILMGLLLMFRLLDEPNGEVAQILSLLPPFAPFITPVRNALSPLPPVELGLSVVVMALGVLAMAGLAGRIYRTGILMYGRRASMGEVLRWLRTHRPSRVWRQRNTLVPRRRGGIDVE